MKASELKIDLESKRNNPDIKDSAKKIFENAITKLESYPEDKEISLAKIRALLALGKITTREAGWFLEFINTNSGPLSETEDSYSEIYYLMHAKQVSCLHGLTTTETWRWIGGSDVILYVIKQDKIETITLNDKNREYTIEKSTLFGAKNLDQADESFSLVTCKCKPGFHSACYDDPSPEVLKSLSKQFSAFSDIITELTPCAKEATESLPTKKFFKQLDCGEHKDKEAKLVEIVKPKRSCAIL